MAKSQLELLVLYQDIDIMSDEALIEEEGVGFKVEGEGKQKIIKAKEELAKNIHPRLIGTYNRLKTRYKRAVAPVQDGTCLACFAKLPTSYALRGRDDQNIITCEQCGRILYWIE